MRTGNLGRARLALVTLLSVAAGGQGAEPGRVPPVVAATAPKPRTELGGDSESEPSHAGYRFLTEKAYLPPDFDQETFDQVWQVWPEPERSKAASASVEVRREMAYARYGLSPRPGDPEKRPLQYVVDHVGNWTMNCFACHGGTLDGVTIPGKPNANYELATLTEDIRQTKAKLGKPLTRMDFGSLFIPLGGNRGTTNAVMFGVGLMSARDPDLNLLKDRPAPRLVHHDMDAPPWWTLHKKKRLYLDGFAVKSVRSLMQFMLVHENGPEEFHSWEKDFESIDAYLANMRPPRFPGPVDAPLAARGKMAFEQNCAECHGTYGDTPTYPERTIPLEEIGTDRVRMHSLRRQERELYHRSWFGEHGSRETRLEPEGYVAPPLDGIWASAPYLHNGSVPTLWHLLHPDQRPVVWRRSGDRLDRDRMGLRVELLPADWRPSPDLSPHARRAVFDTRGFGKSAAGHDYPDQLSEVEKRAVLEYLKTL